MPVHRLVDQPAAAAQYGAAVAENVPGKAGSRPEVLVIGIVETADLVPNLHEAHVRVEVSQQIVGFLWNRAVLVTQAEVESEILCGAIVVLEKSGVRPIVQLQRRVSHFDRGFEWKAGKEIFQRARTIRSRICTCDTTEESNAAARISVGRVPHVVVVQFGSDLYRMLARRVGDVVGKLRDGIGSLEFRPFEAAESGEEISAKTDSGQASGKRAADSCIETVARGRGVEIARQRWLVQTVVAKPQLIDPAGSGRPDPAAAHNLRAGVDLGSPFLL